MDIVEVKETVELLKIANAKSYVTLPELARELGVRKTKIMAHIQEYPELFNLSERWEPKKKMVTEKNFGMTYKSEVQVRGKSLGLCIEKAYVDPSDNYQTDEWLERKKKENEKYLHISEFDNYGYIQGYYVDVDIESQNPNDLYRKHLWRNTPEKIERLKDYLRPTSSVMGGFGDSFTVKKEYGISLNDINKLKGEGWTFNDFRPLSR